MAGVTLESRGRSAHKPLRPGECEYKPHGPQILEFNLEAIWVNHYDKWSSMKNRTWKHEIITNMW